MRYSDKVSGRRRARAAIIRCSFAAGNSSHLIDDSYATTLPQEAVWAAIPNRTLLVGNAQSATANAPSSHYGNSVELWAPGQDWNLPTYSTPVSGTSFSAPAVVGAALLLASHQAGFASNPAALKSALAATADNTVTVTCNSRRYTSQRLLNVERLLGAVPPL